MAEDWGFVDNELRITCADAIEMVTDFLDDALSQDDLANFEAHLSLCEGCRAYVDQVRRTITITPESRDHTVKLTPANFDHLLDLFTRQPKDDDGNGDEA
jgi:predicted anti-sigma-YlaC factor YlaD